MKKTKSLKKLMAIVPLALMSITMAGLPVFDNPVHAAIAPSFSDVPAGHWTYDAISKLVKADIVSGYSDGTFKGDKAMSRYEVAFVVAKAMDKYEKADEANKQLIDKLSSEFAPELNRLGARVAKVEAKTNTWVSGETRMRFMGNAPQAGGTALRGSDRFDFRQRVKFTGNINDDISIFVRLQASGNPGNYNNGGANGTNAGFEAFAITAKNALGMDKIRIGRFPLDSFTHNLFGNAVGVDGIRIDKTIGKVVFTGAVDNLKGTGGATNFVPNAPGAQGDSRTLTTAQLSGKVGDKLGWKTGYYWANIPGTSTAAGTGSMNTNIGGFKSSSGVAVGVDYKMGNVMLIADYVSTRLKDATNLPTSPKGWAVELSSATKQPPIFYGAKYLVDYKNKGEFGWSLSYRSVDAGAVPYGAGGFDQQAMSYQGAPYATVKGTDNNKGWFAAVQYTVAKNVVWTLEGQFLKIKNRGLTNLASDDLGKTYMTKLEFFY